ncbi:MAG: hypothetical protein V6Z78_05285 [Holosporaceae bacterium]
MSSLQGRFSFLLVCGIQLIPQILLQGAGVDAATLDSFTTHTSFLAAPSFSDESNKYFSLKAPSLSDLDVSEETPPLTPANKKGISQRTLSVALYPLDCLRHMALSVLKSPLLFLAATSALPSETQGDDIRYRMLEKRYRQKHPRVTLDLTADWDTHTCKGRALHNQTHTMQLQKIDCRMDACLIAVRHSIACNPPASERLAEGGNLLNLLCDRAACAPYAINLGLSPDVPKNTNNCIKEACLRTGRPYTGRFSCTAPKRYQHNVQKRRHIEHAIFEAETCFERFCQENAQTRCLKEPSWWQRLFGLSPCNEDLCTERFIPDEMKEVSPGVFKTLAQLGEDAIQDCKQVRPYKRHCH